MIDAIESFRAALLPQFQGALDFAAEQASRIIATHPGYYPMYTVGGRWNREGERWTPWCDGFFPGILWLLHKQTRNPQWRRWAEAYSRPLEARKQDRTIHDLGFLFLSTHLRWYRLTEEPALGEVLVEAGRTLALRRQQGGYLASFLGPHSLFIDIMMNVGLIFWAAHAAGEDGLRQIALDHCRTTARCLVRSDGGTAHEGIFDLKSGRFLRTSTQQGHSPASTWARGQAWAIYGFTAACRLSGEKEFLATARKCAGYYLRKAPAGLVPCWDFDAPENGLWDSSAAAIAASGLWDLSEEVDDPVEKSKYRSAALTILQTLCSDHFLARPLPSKIPRTKLQEPRAPSDFGSWFLEVGSSGPGGDIKGGREGWEGILRHGVYHYPKGLGVDESVIWGDHFFVEALVKALAGRSEAAW